MKASNELHRLIHSMSMSEKRHFSIYSSRHVIGKQNNYLRLFDAIGLQQAYDEEEIRKKFAGQTFIRHLPSEKHYLYHLLLESLNAYHKDKTFLARYANILITVELLYNKGLFAQAKKIIARAKREAYSLEKFSVLLILLRWDTIILIKDEDETGLSANIAEELRILEAMRVQTVLMRLAFSVQIQIDKGSITPDFIRRTEHELKRNYLSSREGNTFWANYYYHSAIGLIRSAQHNQKERYEAFKAIKHLMDDAPQFIIDLPGIYHLNSNNLVNVMFYLGKFYEAEALIQQQRQFMPAYGIKRQQLEKIVFLNTCESEIFLHYVTRNYSKAAAISRQIESEVRKTDAKFSPVVFDLVFMMAVAELSVKNYKAASRLLNKVLNAEKEIYLRREILINSRLLYLITLYESGDRLFENRFSSARRFLSNEKGFTTQRKILEAIRLVSDEADPKKVRKLLAEIKQEQKRSPEMALNKQYDFAGWIECHI